jgi:hypothetical protein
MIGNKSNCAIVQIFTLGILFNVSIVSTVSVKCVETSQFLVQALFEDLIRSVFSNFLWNEHGNGQHFN